LKFGFPKRGKSCRRFVDYIHQNNNGNYTVIVQKLFYEVDMGQQHSSAAVSFESKLIKSLSKKLFINSNKILLGSLLLGDKSCIVFPHVSYDLKILEKN
jgi:hypothetical protein